MFNVDNFGSKQQTTGPTYSACCLLTIISTPGKMENMIRFALRNGALTAHSCFAHGTVPNHLLSLLGLAGVRRELVIFAVPEPSGQRLMDLLCSHFKLGEETNGIAFLQKLTGHPTAHDESDHFDHIMIAAIVNEGEGEYVVESARRYHPVGASILRALGSADHSQKTFDFEIFPNKEIVLIIARSYHEEALCQAIFKEMRSESPGKGILFSTGLERVEGILDATPDHDDRREYSDSPKDLSAPDDAIPARDYRALFAVVNRGHTGEVVSVAERCGGGGATILHVRQTDSESQSWYSRLSDTEKEIVLMLAPQSVSEAIRMELAKLSTASEGSHMMLGQLNVNGFRQLSDQGTIKESPGR